MVSMVCAGSVASPLMTTISASAILCEVCGRRNCAFAKINGKAGLRTVGWWGVTFEGLVTGERRKHVDLKRPREREAE